MRRFFRYPVLLLIAVVAAIAAAGATADAEPLPEQSTAPGWVLPGAALDDNFAAGLLRQQGRSCRGAAACLNTARASAGTAVDASGNWYQYAAGAPRVTNLGLLVEEGRTNVAINSVMAGASVVGNTPPTGWSLGSLSGIAATVAGTGTVQGVNYVDVNYAGTIASPGNIFPGLSCGTISASPGDNWTISAFNALVAGSLSNVQIFLVSNFDHGGNVATGNIAGSLTGTPQRFSQTSTAPAGTTQIFCPGYTISLNAAGAYNFTLRIGWPQLELGGFATSPILTTTGPVTRVADFITVAAPPAFGAAFSMYAAATPNAPASFATTQTPIQIDEGDNNSRIDIDRGATSGSLGSGITVATTAYTAPNPLVTWNTGTTALAAYAVAPNDQAMVANGSLATYGGGNPTFIPSRIILGANGNGQHQFNGTIARVAVWPATRLPNALLQQIAP